MLRLHPRSTIVAEARRSYVAFMAQLEQQYDLTYDELFMLHSRLTVTIVSGMQHEVPVLEAIAVATTHTADLRWKRERTTPLLHAYFEAIGPLQEKFELTYAEWLSVLGSRIADLATYLIRTERHPNDPDKRGDEA